MKARWIVVLALSLASCTSGGDEPTLNPSADVSQPAKPPTVTVLANNVVLSTEAPAFLMIDPATPSAAVILDHDPAAHIDLYLTESANLPATACVATAGARADRSCVRDVGTGVKETLERPSSAGAVGIVLRSGPGTVNVRLEYDEGSRSVGLRLPTLAPPPGASVCKDNGCNPFLEVMPLRAGSLIASATFTGGPGLLQILQGSVIAHSYSATGIPYRIPAEQRGASPLKIQAHTDAPGEYAVAFYNDNPGAPITAIGIEAIWT